MRKVRLYDETAQVYHRRYLRVQRLKYQAIAKYLQDKLVIDVGVGTGIGLPVIIDFAPLIGVDGSIEMLRIAVKQAQKIEKGKEVISFVCAAAEALPFKDQSFPTVVSITVIQNLANIQQGIQELRRVCKPSGLLIVTALAKAISFHELESLLKPQTLQITKLENLANEDHGIILRLLP